MRRFLIVFITAVLAKNLPSYGTYPPVEDLLMHLTGTGKDKQTGKLFYKRTWDEVFANAYKKAREAEEWKLLGADAEECTRLGESSCFKYRIDYDFPEGTGRVEGILSKKDRAVSKIYKFLLSEDFARALLTDKVVDAFYGSSGSLCSLSVSSTKIPNTFLYDFYVTYSLSGWISMKFKVTCDTKGNIKDDSACVIGIKVIDAYSNIEYQSQQSMGYYGLLDELRRVLDDKEEGFWEVDREKYPKERGFFTVEKSSFDTEESLEDTFSRYPTPDILLRDLKCSNRDWDDSFFFVSGLFRNFETSEILEGENETSEDKKSQYAESKILFKLQGEGMGLDSKGIPNVSDNDIPSVKRSSEFKQVLKVLLSLDFAAKLFGDSFIRSFLEKDKEIYQSSISVSFKESVDEKNAFDFCITYMSKTEQSCRVNIQLNVCYDADDCKFIRDKKGSKVRIPRFSIGKFEVLPFMGEVLRNDDLKYLASYLQERVETIRETLFSTGRKHFISIVSDEVEPWVKIRSSVEKVCPYEKYSGSRHDVYEDHCPSKCSDYACCCRSQWHIFDFMHAKRWINVKDWLTGGEVVLFRNGDGYWHGKEHYELLQKVKGQKLLQKVKEEKGVKYKVIRYWQERINPERRLISRELLINPKKCSSHFTEKDWPLLKSSVFMVGEMQSDKKSKRNRTKEKLSKEPSELNTILEVDTILEVEEDEEEKEENI